ncbi:MAG: putative rane transporter protein YfcA [Bacteroidota bacterium]|jgi:uncharacterized protein
MITTTLILLCLFAFIAGFVDAIVGGGGLIQTPAGIILMPNEAVSTIIGSLKIPAFTGTAFAVRVYLRKVKVVWKEVFVLMLIAFMSAFAGSQLLTQVSNRFMKPVILIVLVAVAIYTYTKKDFGTVTSKNIPRKKAFLYGCMISGVLGFYDGFIGPGAGSFLVMAFISILGYDFLKAGTHAKLINLSTNFGSISLFLLKGTILWQVAIPMAICNGIGGILGSRLAVYKGNKFIRLFFLAVVTATLIRFAYDIFKYTL